MTWQERERARLRSQIKNDTHVGANGELRWNSNDQPVPMDTFRDAGIEPPANQQREVSRAAAEAIEAYKASRARMTDEERAEEAFEMRAAFGPGERVVNVFTGETRTT